MPTPFLAKLFDAVTSRTALAIALPAIVLTAAAFSFGGKPNLPAATAAASLATIANPAPADATLIRTQAAAPSAPSAPSTFSPQQRKELETIIKEYLMANPEVMLEIQSSLETRMEKVQGEKMAAAIKENAAELFRSAQAPIAGNTSGDVTVVEFFDYNCGYCKKAFHDVAGAIQTDSKIKLVLKELPILSKGSEEAARVALAAKLQGKYWEFHRAMLEAQGQANEATALRVAEKTGLDMARLRRDITSAEVKKEIDDTRKLAQRMGIQGTPHFLVGEHVIAGAPENLAEQITKYAVDVRAAGCKVC